jgi:hypothetical protein
MVLVFVARILRSFAYKQMPFCELVHSPLSCVVCVSVSDLVLWTSTVATRGWGEAALGGMMIGYDSGLRWSVK